MSEAMTGAPVLGGELAQATRHGPRSDDGARAISAYVAHALGMQFGLARAKKFGASIRRISE